MTFAMSSEPNSDILHRILQYCAKSEHCTQDVRQKLISWIVPDDEIEEILVRLRHEKFLDDNRYALSFVTEKWKLDHWGKEKIRNSLLSKGMDEETVQQVLETISEEEYLKGMDQLLNKKRNELKTVDPSSLVKRLMSFAISRGFEEEKVIQWLEANGFDLDL